MRGAGTRKRENAWVRGPASGCALFPRISNARGRERRNSCYECEIYSSTQFTKIANGKVGIWAADVTVGLRRIPAGFYAAVQHSGREWWTENKPVSANNDVVEWDGSIPM